MAKKSSSIKEKIRNVAFKALKATIKGVIFYALYFVVWILVAPVASIVPGLKETVETFVAIYITLMIIGEFASGTIFQYFFAAAKELFIIGYLLISLNGGLVGGSFQNVNFVLDIRFFLMFAVLLGLLGFAKTVLQAISYVSEKAECTKI
ncbi:MAG: hypothetical protein ACP5IM_04885 [Candidatus Bathyarchaeia archaeon]|nr:MAG: hypothetical protein C0195_00810 [Candidatus Bathyarchaeota archaeon]